MHHLSVPPFSNCPRVGSKRLYLTIPGQPEKSRQLYWSNHPVTSWVKPERRKIPPNKYTFWIFGFILSSQSFEGIHVITTSKVCKQLPQVMGYLSYLYLDLWVFTTVPTIFNDMANHFPSLPTLPPFPGTLVVSKMPGLSRNSLTSLSWRFGSYTTWNSPPPSPEKNERTRPLEKGPHFKRKWIILQPSIFRGMFLSFQGGIPKVPCLKGLTVNLFHPKKFQASGVCTPFKKKRSFQRTWTSPGISSTNRYLFWGLALGERRLYLLLRLGEKDVFSWYTPQV